MPNQPTRRTILGSVAALAICAISTASLAQDVTLRLQTFGGDAQLKATEDAVARFEAANPGVKIDIAIDPISNGWGEFVNKV